MSPYRVVNAEVLTQLIERLRINVPSSIRESERTLADRDVILAEAHSEAERIVQEATQRAREMLRHDAIVRTAKTESERIVAEGKQLARQRAEQADQYAVDVLQELAEKLQVISQQVDNGIRMMQDNALVTSTEDEAEE